MPHFFGDAAAPCNGNGNGNGNCNGSASGSTYAIIKNKWIRWSFSLFYCCSHITSILHYFQSMRPLFTSQAFSAHSKAGEETTPPLCQIKCFKVKKQPSIPYIWARHQVAIWSG